MPPNAVPGMASAMAAGVLIALVWDLSMLPGARASEAAATTTEQQLQPRLEVTVPAQKVFRFAFNPNLFDWKVKADGAVTTTATDATYTYRPAVTGLPDLPHWMRYHYSEQLKAGLIYGVPPEANRIVPLDIVSLNKATFETSVLKLVLNVGASLFGDPDLARSVRLKIDNHNLEDLFHGHGLHSLEAIFKQHLWPEASHDLHMTYIASSLDSGFRRPMLPSLKDGVVVQMSSSTNFSTQLVHLFQETAPLRNKFHRCPRNFKRTSVERYFREKGFAVDWCEFRLIMPTSPESIIGPDQHKERQPSPVPVEPRFLPHEFLKRALVPPRSLSYEFLSAVLPATLIFVMLSLVLALLLCFKRPGEQEQHWQGFVESFFLVAGDFLSCWSKADKAESLLLQAHQDFQKVIVRKAPVEMTEADQAARASSVQRQTETLRRLARSRDVSPRLQSPFAPADQNEVELPDQPAATDIPSENTLLDILPRPAPPPYAQGLPSMMVQDDEQVTYLV